MLYSVFLRNRMIKEDKTELTSDEKKQVRYRNNEFCLVAEKIIIQYKNVSSSINHIKPQDTIYLDSIEKVDAIDLKKKRRKGKQTYIGVRRVMPYSDFLAAKIIRKIEKTELTLDEKRQIVCRDKIFYLDNVEVIIAKFYQKKRKRGDVGREEILSDDPEETTSVSKRQKQIDDSAVLENSNVSSAVMAVNEEQEEFKDAGLLNASDSQNASTHFSFLEEDAVSARESIDKSA